MDTVIDVIKKILQMILCVFAVLFFGPALVMILSMMVAMVWAWTVGNPDPILLEFAQWGFDHMIFNWGK